MSEYNELFNDEDLKIFRHFDGDGLDYSEPPLSINYVNGLDIRLEPIHTMTRGRITRTEYHASSALNILGEKIGSDLVVGEDFVYTDDAAGLARYLSQTISWYRKDGSPCPVTKTRSKLYNNTESRTEGRRRRRNVVDSLSIAVVGMLAVTQTLGDMAAAIAIGSSWLAAHELEVQTYIEVSDNGLAAAVSSDTTNSWLDNVIDASTGATIRMAILAELS